ncbi:uncharacterized protein LOC118404513 [Branchiostoma floridae]|uniref:Uncharacterized protein LOC118404513 n=1 Tax=Branchiostoma floridae TaxID=7739 RepID=A0A9J7HK31_BRAFL|nr:uncharacterized protein LOC118404513 [Branchiostoma floridae]
MWEWSISGQYHEALVKRLCKLCKVPSRPVRWHVNGAPGTGEVAADNSLHRATAFAAVYNFETAAEPLFLNRLSCHADDRGLPPRNTYDSLCPVPLHPARIVSTLKTDSAGAGCPRDVPSILRGLARASSVANDRPLPQRRRRGLPGR